VSAQIGPAYSLAPGANGPIGAQRDPREALRAAAEQFEAVFLRQLIGSMRQAKLADDPLASSATEQFRDMSDARLADTMSKQGDFGIAEMLIAQFERNNPASPATSAAPALAQPNGDRP
jgi:flagellar protein FlgJ